MPPKRDNRLSVAACSLCGAEVFTAKTSGDTATFSLAEDPAGRWRLTGEYVDGLPVIVRLASGYGYRPHELTCTPLPPAQLFGGVDG